MITIAYVTCRKNPKWEWFFESLSAQVSNSALDQFRVVVVDFYRDQRQLPDSFFRRFQANSFHVLPKPTVWQGGHRLTSKDYFAPSNARNTALCYAQDGYIAYLDDLSVLMPGWLNSLHEAAAAGYVVCGAYHKVLGITVEQGICSGWRDYKPGRDSRWFAGKDDVAVPCSGQWMYGCSCGMPVEALLKINGWDEDADSMGGEDYITGMMLEKHGYVFKYDRRMLTLESEEDHSLDESFLRIIKPTAPRDASWTLLNMVLKGGRNVSPNYFGPGGIAALRQKILAGEGFPVCQIPEHDWRDGQPLSEM